MKRLFLFIYEVNYMYNRAIRGAKRCVAAFFILTLFWVLLYKFVNPPLTWLMLQRGLERKAEGKNWKIEKEWRDYEDISDNLKKATVAAEDAGFFSHHGFDGNAIQKAYLKNREGKKIRGGSTISQQTAKNVFLWPGRSWIRKGFEAYFTVLIELLWDKERILEVYLNVIEMGQGVYGAEAACQYYYNKSSERLTKQQAALLAAVFPSPRKWSPIAPTRYVRYKSAVIIRNMRFVKGVQ